MESTIISERIKAARENLRITKAEASRRLNLSKIGYCRYEYGERTPSIQTLEVIAKCFNTTVDYLTGKTDDIQPDYIIIHKDGNPALYEFISSISSSNSEQINRLLAYYNTLKKEMD